MTLSGERTTPLSWLDDRVARNPIPSPLQLPERFRNANFLDIPHEALRLTVQDYLTRFGSVAAEGRGCLFTGRARRYKTYAAACIAQMVHEVAKLDVEFVQCGVLFPQMDRGRFSDETKEAIRRMSHSSLVVMDDFAQVPERSWGSTILMEVAETRFANQYPTIWTANIEGIGQSSGERDTLGAIAQLYGAGFARRVHDASEGFRVRIM